MNILFNSSGIPLLMQSTYIFGETTGTPRNEMKERTRILAPYDLSNVSYIDIDGVKVRPWGDENDFPQKAAEEIGNTSRFRIYHKKTINHIFIRIYYRINHT